jgi:hypothetical protein
MNATIEIQTARIAPPITRAKVLPTATRITATARNTSGPRRIIPSLSSTRLGRHWRALAHTNAIGLEQPEDMSARAILWCLKL